MLLTGRNLSKSYGTRLLFAGITLGLEEGERVGLIGANGSGKSTLLKIFAGLETPDEGELISRRGLVVGYVPQEEMFEDVPCIDIVADHADEHLDPHERHTLAERVLSRLGFTDGNLKAGTLSGGWRKRLSIAAQLVKEPQLLLMDEPTNHLDIEGVLWLETLIRHGRFATLVVSHDRRFLEETATRTIELDKRYPDGFLSHNGTYSEYLEKREAFFAAQAGREQSLASQVRREIEWLRRGAKARTTKAKGRVDRAGQMQDELADLKTRNVKAGSAAIDFAASGRKTRKLVQLENVSRTLGGKRLFEQVDLTLEPGSKLGLIGPNGSGKTSLIRLIVGQAQPDTGKVFRADDLQVVLFDQHREQLDLDVTLRRTLFPNGDNLIIHGTPTHVVGWARRFLFRADQLELPIRDLSGGERARVLIARLMLKAADVLILDEPTNDLDIPTLDVLEESLQNFPGAVVLVTHDRLLLDRVSTEILSLDGNGNSARYAELSQWEAAREAAIEREAQLKAAASRKIAAPFASQPSKKRLSWNEQREMESMEASILAAEEKVERLHDESGDPAVMADHVKFAAVCHQLAEAQTRVTQLYERWASLEAKV